MYILNTYPKWKLIELLITDRKRKKKIFVAKYPMSMNRYIEITPTHWLIIKGHPPPFYLSNGIYLH